MTLKQLIAQHALTGTYAAIADALNAPTTVANPQAEPGQVPADITLKAVMALVPVAEAVKIFQLPGYVDNLKIAIDQDDREYLGFLLQVALAAQAISAETTAKLAPMLTATVADPTWTPTIAGPSLAAAAGFGVVSAADVQAALHGG